jgi:hypothetical protein
MLQAEQPAAIPAAGMADNDRSDANFTLVGEQLPGPDSIIRLIRTLFTHRRFQHIPKPALWSDLRKCLVFKLLTSSEAPQESLASDFHTVIFPSKLLGEFTQQRLWDLSHR